MNSSSSGQSAANNALWLIVGVVLGLFASFVLWLAGLFSLAMILTIFGTASEPADKLFIPLLMIIPFIAALVVVYFIISQKPTGLVLGVLIGCGLGLLLQGLCAGLFIGAFG
jgi:hypothetical protein